MDNTEKRLLTATDVAKRYGIAVSTFYSWRTKGKGPRGIAVGKYLRFRMEDVQSWEDAQLESRPGEPV